MKQKKQTLFHFLVVINYVRVQKELKGQGIAEKNLSCGN